VQLTPGVSLFLGVDAVVKWTKRVPNCLLSSERSARAVSVRDQSAKDETIHREKAQLSDPTKWRHLSPDSSRCTSRPAIKYWRDRPSPPLKR